MKITKNRLFIILLTSLIIINLLNLLKINHFHILSIINFIFLITLPGILILIMMKIKKLNFWEYLVYMISLSITFLLFGGLLINWILPLLGIPNPLSLYNIMISFDIIFLIIGLIGYFNKFNMSITIKPIKFDWFNRMLLIIPLIFPILSILGALSLNNNDPNTLTMFLYWSIAIYFFIIIIFRKKINKNIFPYALFMISLSLLLSTSMRSWYVFGSDIQNEQMMFETTLAGHQWSMSNFSKHPYNACLSITILPTIFSLFMSINNQYIFKILFQILFALFPVTLYLLFRRFTNDIYSFLASFIIISYPVFFLVMPMHNRQEIALLFFSMSILSLFISNIREDFKDLLFMIFGLSITISHYSTTYIALAVFVCVYLIYLIYRKTQKISIFSYKFQLFNRKKKSKTNTIHKYHLQGLSIILLLLFSFVWIHQITETSGNIIELTTNSFKNMGEIFSNDFRAEGISPLQQFNIFQKYEPVPILNKYYDERLNTTNTQSYDYLLNSNNINQYRPRVSIIPIIPQKFSYKITSELYLMLELIKKMIKILIILGVILLLIMFFKESKIDREFIIFCLVSLGFLFLITILPYFTIGYDLDRFYLQMLIILGYPAILGSIFLTKKFSKSTSLIIIGLFIGLFFLFNSGVFPQLIGGARPTIQLNNAGVDYSALYTNLNDIRSGMWLKQNLNPSFIVYLDKFSEKKGRIQYDQNINVDYDLFPTLIRKDSYIYLSSSNVKEQSSYSFIQGIYIPYSIPIDIFNHDTNKLYDNGGSVIFY